MVFCKHVRYLLHFSSFLFFLVADFVGFLSVPVVVTEMVMSLCLDQVVNCVDF